MGAKAHVFPSQYFLSPGLKSDILGGNYLLCGSNLPLHRIYLVQSRSIIIPKNPGICKFFLFLPRKIKGEKERIF